MDKNVYIVHCIDTEGPMYESLEAIFDRIREIYGYDIQPTEENLRRLQLKEINLDGLEAAIANLVAPERINMNQTWDQIDKMMNVILDDDYRNQFVDSNNNGWIYNWFCMDHVGFTGYNPRRRDAGYHNIFDAYQKYLKRDVNCKDLIQFHYHPIPFNKDYNISATAYLSSNNLFDILCRKIIDRQWFPSVYRPGFHTERPDSHWFLEQWIPFDYSNQAVNNEETNQIDLSNGRYGDWRRAPKEWKVYHPSHDDYQIEGNCRRWIARCLNMESRIREITIDDFREGFKRAQNGKPTIISFTNHDFRDMKPEIDKIKNMIMKVSKEFTDVNFYFSNAIEAMRKSLGLVPTAPELKIDLSKINKSISRRLTVSSKNGIFGPQPFLAIKTVTGQYFWDNFDFQGKNEWSYIFDSNTIKINAVEKIGIAANSADGVTEVYVYDCNNEEITSKIYNENI